MSNAAIQMYDLNLDECVDLIAAVGHERTVLAEGHMGTGKSSMLKMLAQRFPNHKPIYFDCTTKDLGDLMIPKIKELDGADFVRFATNEDLGLHLGQPVIVMLDEYGKANPSVQMGLTAFMLERQMGVARLHPDSIVFATTNLSSEGVGDTLKSHQQNRITRVRIRKPGHMEWIEWGINNNIDASLLGWVKDNPQLFQTFEEVKNPDENPYIFHPSSTRKSFVTPRSLEAASDLLHVRHKLTDKIVVAGLMGTIGERAAMDLMAFVRLADQLPSLQSIKDDPLNAKVPSSASAVCMVVYRTLSTLEADWIDNWMLYMNRLDKEAQGLFANGVRSPKYSKQQMVMTNRKFTEWAMSNNYLYAADRK
jgi:hypothetical protein